MQKPSEKMGEILIKAKDKGYPDFTNETRYQYPITKSEFVDLYADYIERRVKIEYHSWGYKLLTRKEATTLLADMLDTHSLSVSGKKLTFTDCKKLSAEEQENISKVVNAGLMSGDNGKFKPDAYLSHEQAYLIIIRLYKLVQDAKKQ